MKRTLYLAVVRSCKPTFFHACGVEGLAVVEDEQLSVAEQVPFKEAPFLRDESAELRG